MEILGYLASIFIGIILGLLGGGGSILAIPILVYLFHIEPVMASAYSLFIVGITSLIGAVPKYKEHLVDIRTGLVFGIPSIAAIFSTRKWLIPAIPDTLLDTPAFTLSKRLLILGIFGFLMIAASVSMIRASRRATREDPPQHTGLLMAEGLIIGFLTGLVGAGGGFLIIPALVWLTRLPFKTAVGTSLFIIAINSLIGFAGDVMNYPIDWPFLLALTSLAVLGILIGHRWQRRISGQLLRRMFGWFVLITGIAIMVREFAIGIHSF